MTRKLIAFDIDGTLATGEWKDSATIGQPCQRMVEIVHQLHQEGHILCIWSCRADSTVRRWLKKHRLQRYFMYVNESPYPTDSGKQSFDLVIDDRAAQWTKDKNIDAVYEAVAAASVQSDARDINFSDQNPKIWYQGAGQLFVDHFDGKWQALWKDRPAPAPIAFLTICSHAKPYSKSLLHGTIRKRLFDENLLDAVDYIHISGAGIIPQDKEMVYPFNAYDGDSSTYNPWVKEYHMRGLRNKMAEWMDNILPLYKGAVIYLRNGGNTSNVVAELLRDLGEPENVVMVNTIDRGVLRDSAALPDPDDCLMEEENLQTLIQIVKEAANDV